MKMQILWEGSVHIVWAAEGAITPLDFLHQIGQQGRKDFIDVFAITYRKELEDRLNQIREFEKQNNMEEKSNG